MLTYSWDPTQKVQLQRSTLRPYRHRTSFNLGPHPADPFANTMPASSAQVSIHSADELTQDSVGQEIWVYVGDGGYVPMALSFLICHLYLGSFTAHSRSGDL